MHMRVNQARADILALQVDGGGIPIQTETTALTDLGDLAIVQGDRLGTVE